MTTLTTLRRSLPLFLAAIVLFGLCGCTRTVRPALQGVTLPEVKESSLPQEKLRGMAEMSLDELLQRGRSALANGELQLAQVYFTKALEREQKSPAALVGLGETVFAAGNVKSADILAKEALTLKPGDGLALLLQGRVLREQGDGDGAVDVFNQALALEPENSVAMTELAITFERALNRPGQAEPHYRKVVELLPASAAARNNLGFNAVLRGETVEAIQHFSRALTLDPGSQRIQDNLAAAWLLNGEEGKALQLFRKSVGEPQAYNNIGYLYMSQGKYEQAEKALRKAIELSPRYYARAGANLELLRELQSRRQNGNGK